MARTSLTVQEPTRFTQLANPTQVTPDAVNGNRFVNDGKIVLRVVNAGAGSVTATVDNPRTYDTDLNIPDRVYTIPNGSVPQYLGPWSTDYNQTLDSVENSLGITFSGSSSVTIEVIRVTNV